MNLPWDKSYFKVCFYVIFTFICVYIIKNVIDGIVYAFVNLGDIYAVAMDIVLKVCSVFSIIIAGFVIAYILKPAVNKITEKTGFKRGTAAGIVYGIWAAAAVIAVTILVTGDRFESIGENLKNYGRNINHMYNEMTAFFANRNMEHFVRITENIKNSIFDYAEKFEENALNMSKEAVSRAVTFMLSIVTSFYMLKDEEKITEGLKKYSQAFLSEKQRMRILRLIKDIDIVMSGYVRGQLTDGAIMAGLISLGLSLIKVPFAVPIGIISGFSNIIPYFGSIAGFCLSVSMALVSGEAVRAVYAGILVIVLQQIDSAVIVPKVVGESVKLSPVMIIISLAVAGKLFGVWGMVFAVPVVAVVKMRVDRYVESR